MSKRWSVFPLVCALGAAACVSEPDKASARRVEARHELIGGPRALGEVGDWLLENDQIRVIVQDQGFSRGFGVFGGSLIDADRVRPSTTVGQSAGGTGNDMFGELFPAFFLEALEPIAVRDPNASEGNTRLPAIEVENDGANGEAAVLVVRGTGNDFLALTQLVNETVLSDPREAPTLMFETRYILERGKRYVRIETKVQNVAFDGRTLDWRGAEQLLGSAVPTPFGDVVLFGAGNKVFVPHEAGYDLRFRLEKLYASGQYTLPAFPGIVSEFVATTGPGVSYGILAATPDDPERNYAFSTGQFPEATPHSTHIPFIASAFTGMFQVVPPPLTGNDRQPGGTDEFTFTRFFIVGDGDVASISDVVYDLLGDETGLLTGEVLEEGSRQPLAGANVVVHDLAGAKVTQATVDSDGRYRANLRPGTYRLRTVVEGRRITSGVEVTIAADSDTFQRLMVDAPATVSVTVIERGLGPVPAKVSLVGTVDISNATRDTKEFLFDLSLGEHFLYSDMVPDANDPETRRYIEVFDYTDDGTAVLTGRPGTYDVVVGRGPEYNRVTVPVTLTAGTNQSLVVEIARVIDTRGYIGADFHLHSRYSLDASAGLRDRIRSYAGEGVELAVATDHNFVVDYKPTIGALGLERFIQSMVGLELTTIDRGHFNGFPLEIRPGELRGDGEGGYTNTIASRTLGSFQWAKRTPDEVFAALRALGKRKPATLQCTIDQALAFFPALFNGTADLRDDPFNPHACRVETEPVVVQVNHPRDSILGYFDQYGVSGDDLTVTTPSGLFAPNTTDHPEFSASVFSWEFDAIEVFNGKRFEYLHSFRVPEGATVDPISCCPVVPGNVFRDFRRPYACDREIQDCTCTPAVTAAQIAAGSCEERAVAFPGVFEDWVQILRAGRRVTGTANSDSHEPEKEEPGYPRTYVRVLNDSPIAVTDSDVVTALKKGDALMTNGPYVRATIGEQTFGDIVDASAGSVNLEIVVDGAPWVQIDHIRVSQDGITLLDEPVTTETIGSGDTAFLRATLSVPLTVVNDGFVIVEAYGAASLFPSVYPNEVAPLQFTDVLAAFGSAFGGGSVPGELKPTLTFQTTPFAISNPIWLDANGDGVIDPSLTLPIPGASARMAMVPVEVFTPGGMDAVHVNADEIARFQALPRRHQLTLARLPRWLWPTGRPADARRILFQFMPHAH
jgi:hypothetical protein